MQLMKDHCKNHKIKQIERDSLLQKNLGVMISEDDAIIGNKIEKRVNKMGKDQNNSRNV